MSECKHPLAVVDVVSEETYKKLMTMKIKCLFLKMLTADLFIKKRYNENTISDYELRSGQQGILTAQGRFNMVTQQKIKLNIICGGKDVYTLLFINLRFLLALCCL